MVAPTTHKTYIGLTEAADFVGMSKKSLRRYISAGQLPAFRLGPREIRIRTADLEALLTRIPTVNSAA